MKVDVCDCTIVYALYMVDSYLSSQGDGGDLYMYYVWFKVNAMFIYILNEKKFVIYYHAPPHANIYSHQTKSKIGLIANNIYICALLSCEIQ